MRPAIVTFSPVHRLYSYPAVGSNYILSLEVAMFIRTSRSQFRRVFIVLLVCLIPLAHGSAHRQPADSATPSSPRIAQAVLWSSLPRLPQSVHSTAGVTSTIYVPNVSLPLPIHEFDVPIGAGPAIALGADGNLWFGAGVNLGRITPKGISTSFPFGTRTTPTDIAMGSDGYLWCTVSWQFGSYLRRFRLTGEDVDVIYPPRQNGIGGIVVGSDGNIWYTVIGGVVRVTPTISSTEFRLPNPLSGANDITAGPDGNLWFTEENANQIGRITPSGVIAEFPIPTPQSRPTSITAGPDGNLWFIEQDANQIGRITPSGVIAEFPIPTPQSNPYAITSGPDGNLWFTEQDANQIGRIAPSGVITEYPIPTPQSQPTGITVGSDGALWFTETAANKIGRIEF
jgi:virginiamycin B lyase